MFYDLFIIVTIFGTMAILKIFGIPNIRLFESDTKAWHVAFGVATSISVFWMIVSLVFQIRFWDTSAFALAFLPFGIYLWTRCLFLVRSRNLT